MNLPDRYRAIRQRCDAAKIEWRGCRWNHATGILLDEDIPTLLADIEKLVGALEPFAAISSSSQVSVVGYEASKHVNGARAVLQEIRGDE